jgi:hypothetical protein
MSRLPPISPPGGPRLRSLRRACARLACLVRLCAAVALAACCGAAQADDLAAHVAIAVGAPVLSPTANLSRSTVTITNTSQNTIAAPFTLKIAPLTAPGVALTHPDKVHYTLDVDVNVQLPHGVLPPGAQVAVPIQFANRRRIPFQYAASATGTLLTAQNSTALTVTAWRYSGDAANPRGAPAGAGVSIVVDGVVRAVTNADSQATVLVPLGQQTVAARQAPTSAGIAHLALDPDGPNSADVVMGDDAEVYAQATFRFDETVQSVLPKTAPKLTGRFIAPDGSTIRLTQLAGVDGMWTLLDGRARNLKEYFVLDADGTIRCTSPSAVTSAANMMNMEIMVTGFDAAGNVYRGRVPLVISDDVTTRTLRRPPTAPALDLGGIPIVARVSRGATLIGIERTVTEPDGTFTLPDIRIAETAVSVHVERDGENYVGAQAARYLSSLELASAASIRQEPDHVAAEPDATEAGIQFYTTGFLSRSASLIVKQGTRTLLLTYAAGNKGVNFDASDAWGLRVLAGPAGTVLFDTFRLTAEQRDEFIDYTGATTGRIERRLDVSALARDGDVEVTLQGHARPAWSRAVRLDASLRAEEAMTIESMTLGDVTSNATVAQRYVSMPDSGSANLVQRRLRVVTALPPGAVITNVKVDLEWIYERAAVTVLDGPPGADTLVDGAVIDTLVTFRSDPGMDMRQFRSKVPTQYRVTVTAQAPDGTTLTASGFDTARWPMWRAPANLARYGLRDPGGDDWVSDSILRWLDAHPGLVGRIGDFSGEHGQDLGHAGHGDGNEFDLYPFYTFAGADPESAVSNYRQLVARIRDLPRQGSANPAEAAAGRAAADEVKAWILASRSGIDALISAKAFSVAYILGGPDSAGIAGIDWGEKLLRTGRVTVGGKLFDLGTGTWDTAYLPLANHHHHLHVALIPDFYR